MTRPMSALQGGAFGAELTEDEAALRVFLSAGGLVVLGVALLCMTVWWWRSTRPEPPALGPLEVMGDRKWLTAGDSERRRLVDVHRPDGGSTSDLVVAPPIDLSVLARGVPNFDDLQDVSLDRLDRPMLADPEALEAAALEAAALDADGSADAPPVIVASEDGEPSIDGAIARPTDDRDPVVGSVSDGESADGPIGVAPSAGVEARGDAPDGDAPDGEAPDDVASGGAPSDGGGPADEGADPESGPVATAVAADPPAASNQIADAEFDELARSAIDDPIEFDDADMSPVGVRAAVGTGGASVDPVSPLGLDADGDHTADHGADPVSAQVDDPDAGAYDATVAQPRPHDVGHGAGRD